MMRSPLRAFGVLLVIFIVTHVVPFPGSLAYFSDVTGGQPILDLRPSFAAADTYARLDAMGDAGRAAYLKLILLVDILFPLAMLNFLLSWTRKFARDAALRGTPWIYLVADFVENAFVLAMLLAWPAQLTLLGATIGVFTVSKRAAMVAAVLLPPLVALWRHKAAHARERQERRRHGAEADLT